MVLDLPHGILSLDDFPFSPQTTMDELLTSGLPVRASSCDYFVQPVPSLWMAPISSLNSVSLPAIYCGSSSGHASNILHPWRINASGNSFALSYVLVGCLSDWAGRQNNRRAKIATSSLGDISALWLTSLPEASIMRATLF